MSSDLTPVCENTQPGFQYKNLGIVQQNPNNQKSEFEFPISSISINDVMNCFGSFIKHENFNKNDLYIVDLNKLSDHLPLQFDQEFIFGGAILKFLAHKENPTSSDSTEVFNIIEKYSDLQTVQTYKNQILNSSQSYKGLQFERFVNGKDIRDSKVINNRGDYQHLRILNIDSSIKNILIFAQIDGFTQNENQKIVISEFKNSSMNQNIKNGLHWQIISNGSENLIVGESSTSYPHPVVKVEQIKSKQIFNLAKNYMKDNNQITNLKEGLKRMRELCKQIEIGKQQKLQFDYKQVLQIQEVEKKQSFIPNGFNQL